MIVRTGTLQFLRTLVAVLIVAVGAIWWVSREPVPYVDVEIVEIERQPGNHVFVHATYIKTDTPCEYRSGQAFVVLPGDRMPIHYEPIRGPGQDELRHPGFQHMRVNVDLNGWWDSRTIQFFTRHECRGRIVDTLMWEIDTP